MAGLFDFLSQNPAITQGLLAGAFGALAGRGTRAQAWGQGGLAALQGYGNALNQQAAEQDRQTQARRAQIQEQMLQMQLENAQRQQQGQKATQDYLTQALSPVTPSGANVASGITGPRPEALQAVGKTPGFSLEDALKAGVPLEMIPTIQQTLQGKPDDYKVVGGSLVRIGSQGVEPVFTAPKEEDLTKLIVRGPDGKPMINQMAFDVQRTLREAGRPSTTVRVGMMQEGEEKKAVGKFLGEQYAEIQKAGIGAQGKLDRASRMEQLLSRINTGKFEGVKKEAAAVGQAFGITIDPRLGDKEAFEALSNQLALEARNPSGGAGMPGAMSDKDREFLLQITPNLTKTQEGNRTIIDTAKKLAKREADVARLARSYRAKHGALDEGFFEELRQFSDSNPLFKSNAPVGNVDALVDKYRSK